MPPRLEKNGAPVLTVGIPTRGRAALLRKCLESIASSARGFEERIEVVVSDNASTDDTAAVVSDLSARAPYIRYFRNDTDIGGEMNFRRTVLLSRSAYVWIIGDDDRITEDAIQAVLERIDGTPGPDLILCNHSQHSEDFLTTRLASCQKIKEDMRLTDCNEVMKLFGTSFGFISSVIFPRDAFLEVPVERYEKYKDLGFSFLYTIYALALKGTAFFYIGRPIVQQRADWSIPTEAWYRMFVVGLGTVFRDLQREGYAPRSVRKAKNQAIREHIWTGLYADRIAGRLPPEADLWLRTLYGDCWSYWIYCMPLRLPRGVLKTAKDMVKVLWKPR